MPAQVDPVTSLRDQVTQRLRAEIVTGSLRPGQRLTEQRLSRRYFVSRTPVRHALQTLETEGFVSTVHGNCRIVSSPGSTEGSAVFAVRAAVEVEAAGLACQRASLVDLRALKVLLDRGLRAVDDGDLDAVARLNTALHRGLVTASGSAVLDVVHAELAQRMTWMHPRLDDLALRRAWEEHRGLLEAVVRRDVIAAERLAHRHVAHCRDASLGRTTQVRVG